ncbi:MAG: T9SS type A sorting domain-containing protein [Chitinophagales bacterium]
MKKFTLLLAVFVGGFFISANGQTLSCQPNMDFELGNYSNWIYNIGTCCPITTPTVYTPPGSRFTLTSGTGLDACCSFPVVGAGVYSLRLGSNATLYLAEKATYYVHVPATVSNYSLVYRYAYVLQLAGHALADEARFEIKAIDSATGAVIVNSSSTTGTPGTYTSSGFGTTCKPWTTQTVNLTGYNGSTIIISFSAGDCGLGGHFGYGYVDMTCGLFAISTVAGCSSTVQMTAPAGFASYAWYDSATFTTSYGTTETTVISAPSSPTTYAVILTPAPGFGNPDTLYTIVYPPTCTGTPIPGIVNTTDTSSCAISPFTLTNTGYTGSTDFQWQSSPDSLTWSNITGATTVSYTVSGISSTTYFRCKDSCCGSGLTAATAGVKIIYIPCCSGTPVAGFATASTTYCSGCILTLNLTGFTNLPGMAFQWQSSPDSLTWTNMTGAVSVPYTFTPTGVYYYRCVVTCTASGLFAYSGGVYVLYHYLVVTDTVGNTSGSPCPGPGTQFYVKVNGTSPFLCLKTYYGDGTKDSISFTPATGYSYTAHNHNYAVSGTYTIKQIVYWNNIPQDSVKFIYVYLRCNMLHIAFYIDANGNCIKDAWEPFSTQTVYVEIDTNGIAIDTLPVASGLYYKAYGTVGTVYSFRVLSPAFYASCPASGILYDTISSINNYPIKYFGLTLSCSSMTDYDLVVYPTVICGRHMSGINVLVNNSYCIPENAILTMNISPKYQFTSSNPAPSSVTGNTITWQLNNVSAATAPPYIQASLDHSVPYLPIGDTVHNFFSVTPTIGDVNPGNNTNTRVDTVKASYDPNYLEVTPSGCFPVDTLLQYTINFENTGNDTAFNIHVMDTLSDNLDMSSLKILAESAEMNVALYKDSIYNIVKFDFPNINLLDSSYHNQCNGTVIFTVNTLPGLADGSTIFSQAGIYFDDNDVVMTNTVENIKGCYPEVIPVINNTHKAEIYPNPATDELTIKMDEGAYNSFTITNNVGQVLIQQVLTKTLTKVNVKMLPPGLYYVTMKGDNGTMTRKFVKM